MSDEQVPSTPETPDPGVADQVGKAAEREGRAGAPAGDRSGDGTLFGEPVLVVNQKAKFIEVTNEYTVFDQYGTRIGAVREVGQGMLRKALRLLTSFDQYLTHRYEVVDASGAVQLQVTRPAKFLKSRFVIADATGNEIGAVVQDNVVGKKRFRLETAAGAVQGMIQAENWRAWDFSIRDHLDQEVARVTKTWEGLAKAAFTTADNYVVRIHRDLDEPLRSLVVASALSIDTALKQDASGFN
ncbi:MAG TPA: phospholipid scramblase-related protein [Acidimicrobiia bacterium]|nr:phospholipid scramblase-related protein [Acidimicrobiia bacterium]